MNIWDCPTSSSDTGGMSIYMFLNFQVGKIGNSIYLNSSREAAISRLFLTSPSFANLGNIIAPRKCNDIFVDHIAMGYKSLTYFKLNPQMQYLKI